VIPPPLVFPGSYLAAALGVTNLIYIILMNGSNFIVLLKSNLDGQQLGLCWTSKSDLSSTSKWDQNHMFDNYEFGHM